MRKFMFRLAPLVLCPRTAAATPVSSSVEPWRSSDGNFGFPVIHAATRGLMQMGGMDLHAGGSIQDEFSSPTQYMTGDLSGSVLNLDAYSLQLDGGSISNFESSVLNFGIANGSLIGALGYELIDGVEAMPFRGIDLGGAIVAAAVPEPSAALSFGIGSLVVGGGIRRRRATSRSCCPCRVFSTSVHGSPLAGSTAFVAPFSDVAAKPARPDGSLDSRADLYAVQRR